MHLQVLVGDTKQALILNGLDITASLSCSESDSLAAWLTLHSIDVSFSPFKQTEQKQRLQPCNVAMQKHNCQLWMQSHMIKLGSSSVSLCLKTSIA